MREVEGVSQSMYETAVTWRYVTNPSCDRSPGKRQAGRFTGATATTRNRVRNL